MAASIARDMRQLCHVLRLGTAEDGIIIETGLDLPHSVAALQSPIMQPSSALPS